MYSSVTVVQLHVDSKSASFITWKQIPPVAFALDTQQRRNDQNLYSPTGEQRTGSKAAH